MTNHPLPQFVRPWDRGSLSELCFPGRAFPSMSHAPPCVARRHRHLTFHSSRSPKYQVGDLLIQLYHNFVTDFEHKISPLKLGRGLHSVTSRLNLSAFYGIGGARGGCVARVKGVLGDV